METHESENQPREEYLHRGTEISRGDTDFNKKYLKGGVWPEMDYRTQQKVKRDLRESSRASQKRRNDFSFSEKDKQVKIFNPEVTE